MSNTEGASAETDEKRNETAKVCTFFKRSGRQGGGGRRKRPIQSAAADDDDAGMHHGRVCKCISESVCLHELLQLGVGRIKWEIFTFEHSVVVHGLNFQSNSDKALLLLIVSDLLQ